MKKKITPMDGALLEYENDDGSRSRYLKIAARRPAFLEKYSPDKGYSEVIDPVDFCGITASRNSALNEFIRNGGTTAEPSEFTLKKLGGAPVVQFLAKMISPDGKIMETASSLAVINNPKDYETGETAARGRLMAALGFGSEDFLTDEPTQPEVDASKKTTEPSVGPQQQEPETKPKIAANGEVDERENQKWIAIANQIRNVQSVRGITGDIPMDIAGAQKMMKDLLRNKDQKQVA